MKYIIFLLLIVIVVSQFVLNNNDEKHLCENKNWLWDDETEVCIRVGYGYTEAEMDIQVIGSDLFVEQVTKALYLLQHKSPDTFYYVKNYIRMIKQARNGKGGMKAWVKKPTFYMTNVTTFHSLTWAAAAIVHDSYHSYLYHSHKERFPNEKVPYKVWAEQEAELKCNAIAIEALYDINAPSREISYTKSLDGNHGDLDGDGKYNTPNDKRLRAQMLNSRSLKPEQRDVY